jgi:hypothetical protein
MINVSVGASTPTCAALDGGEGDDGGRDPTETIGVEGAGRGVDGETVRSMTSIRWTRGVEGQKAGGDGDLVKSIASLVTFRVGVMAGQG